MAENRSRAATDERTALSIPEAITPSSQHDLDTPMAYCVGVVKGAPYERIELAGQEFCVRTEDKEQRAGETVSNERAGRIVALTGRQVVAIRAAAKKKFLRGGKSTILVAKDERYVAQPFDVPVSTILYMVPAPAPGTVFVQAPAGGTGF